MHGPKNWREKLVSVIHSMEPANKLFRLVRFLELYFKSTFISDKIILFLTKANFVTLVFH